ncbi:DUF2062 domain-containing protein [Thioclava sp. F28-4]|uniref:DUF2062 domain-containing protein n=1 Tax=Thioclava sp. F28-4 TaxID=1915315 RepID=UPI0009981F56|nr:DUF2062 domain-containing protein [Thioclava sp. F28-4]OOY04175.1 hypothetical protein BMI87_14715 [Thioclava sp. F28-4]
MVFRRREKRGVWANLREAIWPRSGWSRAFQYVKHRVNRLPDRPHRIARGVWAGVLVSFTPLFGFHFVSAAAVAWIMRGNILAAILATFFGNPVTFPIIAVFSTKLGHKILGDRLDHGGEPESLLQTFQAASHDLLHNFWAMFTPEHAEWSGLERFFTDVWLPYLIGGIGPGVIAATICYYVSLPIITAYQNRRRSKLKARLEKMRAKIKREERAAAGKAENSDE